MTVLTPVAKMQFLDASGAPLVGGLLYTYNAGTTTPQPTYTDSTGATANTNPVVLNARGEANIWLGAATYKFKLCDANNTEIWTVDNISAPTTALSPVLSGNVIIASSSSGAALKIVQTGTGPIFVAQNVNDPDTTPVIIDANNNLGVQTTSPGAALDVGNAGSIWLSNNGVARSIISADGSNSYYSAEGARGIIFKANSINLIYGSNNGFVGIKNASPAVELDVTGALNTSGNITCSSAISSTGAITAGSTLASTTTLTAGSSLNVTTSATIGTTLSVDTVQEKTSSAGVSVSSVLKVDTINGKTTPTTISIAGVSIASSQVDPSNRVITTRTAQATTSGTSVEFASIPSWVKRITLMINGLTVSGADNLLIQLGTASSYTFTYTGSVSTLISEGSPANTYPNTSTSGFILYNPNSAVYGIMTIVLCDTNTWVSIHQTRNRYGSGVVALGATLTRLKLILSGSNTFTAGSVNILYE